MNKKSLLRVRDLKVSYDQVAVLQSVSFSVESESIAALMGPNGSGKSTILKSLFGLVAIREGSFEWSGKKFKPAIDKSFELGISYVPQGRQLFQSLTVKENIEMGAWSIQEPLLVQDRLLSVLDLFPALRPKLKERAGNLSGGQQQMVALARGLMTDPKLLLLDEPTLGLAPKVVREVFQAIDRINRERGIAVLVVEHNIKSLLPIVDRAYFLDQGNIVYENEGDEISLNKAYKKLFM